MYNMRDRSLTQGFNALFSKPSVYNPRPAHSHWNTYSWTRHGARRSTRRLHSRQVRAAPSRLCSQVAELGDFRCRWGWRWAFLIQGPLFILAFMLATWNIRYVTPVSSCLNYNVYTAFSDSVLYAGQRPKPKRNSETN
jgi:hypothetical protein